MEYFYVGNVEYFYVFLEMFMIYIALYLYNNIILLYCFDTCDLHIVMYKIRKGTMKVDINKRIYST